MTSDFTKRPGFARELAGTGYVAATDSIRVQAENSSMFGEFLSVTRTPIIELNSAHGTSLLRDAVTLTGSASKDDINGSLTSGEISISTGATASSKATLASAETARYIPGYSAQIGVGCRIPTAPVGNQTLRFGGRGASGQNGFYFIYDVNGLGVARLKEGVETVVYQSSWNVDKGDGTGRSGVNIDFSLGHIFQIDYTWYGYGNVEFSIVETVGILQRVVVLHVIDKDSFTGTSIADPSLQIFAEVENGATASNLTTYVGGRQFSILGDYVPKYRFTGDNRAAVTVTTALTPLVSFRIKTAFQNRSIQLENFSAINTGANTGILAVVLDGTLTGASWVTPSGYTALETAVEADRSATAITGGDIIWQGDMVPSGLGSRVGLGGREIELDLPANSQVTLCGKTFSSTTTLQSSFTLKEEW